MRKKISLVILSNSGASGKQFTISAVFLRVFFVGCLMAATALGYDYYRLKISAVTALDNTLQLSNQTDEVMRQREQIQEFAEEISTLKTKLVALNDFEKKIRIIANIESTEEQDNLFRMSESETDIVNYYANSIVHWQ